MFVRASLRWWKEFQGRDNGFASLQCSWNSHHTISYREEWKPLLHSKPNSQSYIHLYWLFKGNTCQNKFLKQKDLTFHWPVCVHPQGTSYLTNVNVAFSFLKLHHHSLTTWTWNNQFIQTLLQQATFKRNSWCDWSQVASWCSTQDSKCSACTAFNGESWCW